MWNKENIYERFFYLTLKCN